MNAVKFLLVVVCLAIFSPRAAESAICVNDTWGGRTASIERSRAEEATLIAQTNVVHLGAHPACQGNFTAKVQLVGGSVLSLVEK